MQAAVRSRQTGFTLIELLISMGVITILMASAWSLLPAFIQKIRMTTEVNHFITALHIARNEAVKYGRRIVLCPTANGFDCADSSQWQNGWILFASENREHEADEQILRAGDPLGAGIEMRSGNRRKRIVYQQDGSSGGTNSSFTFCDRRGMARPKVICLSNTGRPRLTLTRCDGRPIDCSA